MRLSWFTSSTSNVTPEQRLSAELGKNIHNGLADRWLARTNQVNAHFSNPARNPMPVTAYYDGDFMGSRATIWFVASALGDELTIIYGSYGVVKAFNSGNGYNVTSWQEDVEPAGAAGNMRRAA